MSSTKKITVAIVDDDTSLCHAMDRLLRAAGFQAVTYLSGEAFLEDPEHGRADCILLDIQLGGMSGFELQNLLTASGSTTPRHFHHRSRRPRNTRAGAENQLRGLLAQDRPRRCGA